MSMPMARPVGPTFAAARNTSKPPPEPKSTTVSPSRKFARAVGLPHDKPMLASAGIDASSSGVYPNASATARTPCCSDDKSLSAIEPYLDRTARSIFSDICSLHFHNIYHVHLHTRRRIWSEYLPL